MFGHVAKLDRVVQLLEQVHEGRNLVAVHQVDSTAAPAGASEAGTERAVLTGDVHDKIQLGGAAVVVATQALVTRVHNRSQAARYAMRIKVRWAVCVIGVRTLEHGMELEHTQCLGVYVEGARVQEELGGVDAKVFQEVVVKFVAV